TGLPLIYLGVPLWRALGPLGLLIPAALGALAAAWAGGRLARNLGASTGALAVLATGLATPLLFYAADFWEHAPAVGCLLAALALLTHPTPTATRAVAGGGLLGLAAVLRTEELLYIAAIGVAVLAVAPARRWASGRRAALAAGAAASGAVFAANLVVQRRVIGTALQGVRAGSQATEVGSGLGQRSRDSLLTFFGLFQGSDNLAILLGVVCVGGLVALALGVRQRSGAALRWGTALTVASYVMRVVSGTQFIPGTIPASPMAPLGAVDGMRPGPGGQGGAGALGRPLVLGSLAAAPLVWALSWRGDLVAQWGGRYTITTGILLTIVAAAALERRPPPRGAAVVVLLGAVITVSMLGAIWHVQRARSVDSAMAAVNRVDPDVVIVTAIPHLGREAGTRYRDRRWLRLDEASQTPALAKVLLSSGVQAIDLMELDSTDAAPPVPGYVASTVRHVDYLGFDLRLTRYQRSS
ncbi:MAG: hypothetical protein ABIV94_01830, partial [Acidimicrobiales bacterium]